MSKSQTQDNALTAGAELIVESAKDIGQKCGLKAEVASTIVLERSLAIAWVDILMFQGANPGPERLKLVIEEMTRRITEEVFAQNILRRGHAANYGKKAN